MIPSRHLEISEATKVPLGAVFALLLIFCTIGVSGIFWLSTMYADVAQAKRDIQEQKGDQKEVVATMRRVERGLLKVQVKLGIKTEEQQQQGD